MHSITYCDDAGNPCKITHSGPLESAIGSFWAEIGSRPCVLDGHPGHFTARPLELPRFIDEGADRPGGYPGDVDLQLGFHERRAL